MSNQTKAPATKPASQPVDYLERIFGEISKSLKPKVVISAYLHKAAMLPSGQTESSLTQQRLPGIKMYWARSEGLIVIYKNHKSIIPAANVAIANVDDGEE